MPLFGTLQVGGAAIVSWAFSELREKRFDEELGASLAWEALYAAINKTIARTQVRHPVSLFMSRALAIIYMRGLTCSVWLTDVTSQQPFCLCKVFAACRDPIAADCWQDARDDVTRAAAEMREHNPGLAEDEVLSAIAPAQAALDDAIGVQQVHAVRRQSIAGQPGTGL
jgi:hypothetical protein